MDPSVSQAAQDLKTKNQQYLKFITPKTEI